MKCARPTRHPPLALAIALTALGALAACSPTAPEPPEITPEEARAIAKEAYIYGFPMVDNYRVMHAYFVDTTNAEYKAPFNTLLNLARVFTPEDRAVQTPNSDTPYSFLGMDLRAEPIVLTVPPIEAARYFSIQLVDLYTFNFDYIGSRATGNGGGSYLVVGPDWNGATPAGISRVIRSETELVLAPYRTQLFNPEDLPNVQAVQAGYQVRTLSAFLDQAAPPSAPAIAFVAPLTPETQRTSPEVFEVLNFVLQFCPTHPSETALMERFARIGIGAGGTYDAATLSPEMRAAIEGGIADAWEEFATVKARLDGGEISSGDVFGTRAYLENNYTYRMVAAVTGIYGNSKEEALYPAYVIDAQGRPLDGGNRYTLRFTADGLPPVNAFWSLTLYEMPSSLLSANPLNRYLLNSPMLPQFVRDADGGLTLYIQHESPGAALEPNWLPAPEGAFAMAMRLYWPKPEALDGRWTAPPLARVE